MNTADSAKKRQSNNGRTRKPGSLDDIKLKRDKNRQAQQAFRRRRRAEDEWERKRKELLEGAVRDMSTIVTTLIDELLQAKSLQTHYPGLAKSLPGLLAEVLDVVKRVETYDEKDGAMLPAAATPTKDPEDKGSTKEPSSRNELPSQTLYPDQRPGASPTELSDGNHPVLTHGMRYILDAKDAQISQPSVRELPLTSPASSQLRAALSAIAYNSTQMTSFQTRHLSMEAQRALRILNGFAMRLLQGTLQHAESLVCEALELATEAPAGRFRYAFDLCLEMASPQHILRNIAYLLGPGREQMYVAAGIYWGILPDSGIITWSQTLSALSGINDVGTNRDGVAGQTFDNITGEEYLSVLGVIHHLERLGATMLDEDEIQLAIQTSNASNMDTLNHMDKADPFGIFLHEAADVTGSQTAKYERQTWQPRAAWLIMELNISRLCSALANTAKCAAKGPVFPKAELGHALQAAVVRVYETLSDTMTSE